MKEMWYRLHYVPESLAPSGLWGDWHRVPYNPQWIDSVTIADANRIQFRFATQAEIEES